MLIAFSGDDQNSDLLVKVYEEANDTKQSIKGHCPQFCVNGNRIQL